MIKLMVLAKDDDEFEDWQLKINPIPGTFKRVHSIEDIVPRGQALIVATGDPSHKIDDILHKAEKYGWPIDYEDYGNGK